MSQREAVARIVADAAGRLRCCDDPPAPSRELPRSETIFPEFDDGFAEQPEFDDGFTDEDANWDDMRQWKHRHGIAA